MLSTTPPVLPRSARILVAEDSPTQAQRLIYILSQRGYEVQAAADGRQALAMARSERPALVISDVVMPEMDGYELTREIKSDPQLRGTPVILVTTMSDPQDVIRGLECGADCFILKPYDEQHLIGRVHYILLNREFRQSHDSDMGVEIHFNGQRHYITADRLQILNLLLSTYDAAIQRFQELSLSREALERKTAEEEAGRRLLDAVLDHGTAAVLLKDACELRYVRANRAAEALLGDATASILGRTAMELYGAGQEALVRRLEHEALATGCVQEMLPLEIATPHRGVRAVRLRMVPVLQRHGDASHLVEILEDVTDDVAAQADIQALEAELQALRQALESKTRELEQVRQRG